MDKLALLRKLNEQAPAVAEQFITRWGGAELCSYMDSLIVTAPRSGALSAELLDTLETLKVLYLAEFPQFAELRSPAEILQDNEHFRVVLEGFPHVAAKLIEAWGTHNFHPVMEGLLKVDRVELRQGFPAPVAQALMRLSAQHDIENPDVVPQVADIWALTLKDKP